MPGCSDASRSRLSLHRGFVYHWLVAGDEEESKAPLPGRVEQALERARAAAKADRERKDGRWLALVPVVIGVIFLALLMPHSTTPDAVPLPSLDRRVLA